MFKLQKVFVWSSRGTAASAGASAPGPRIGAREKEGIPMQLTDLIDRSDEAALTGDSIPCRENDAELWFAETPEGVEFAKALCQTCPAIAQCLAGALDRSEPWGVWGGQLFVQGVVVARKRPRGRPRKNPVAA